MSELKHEHEHEHCHEHKNEYGHEDKHAHENDHDHSLDPAIFSETYELLLMKESSTLPVQEALVHWIEEILKWVSNNKGFVGHIKVFIEGMGTENLWLSSTGKAINMNPSAGWSEAKLKKVTINATAIIFGTTKVILDGYARQCFEDCVEKEYPVSTLVKR